MKKDPTISLFWWHTLFLISAMIMAIWLVWPETIEPVDLQYNYLGFYQTAVAGFMAYEGNEILAEITYYTNRRRETDNTPNITASNQEVREGIVANNKYPFGTKVEIDGQIYEVQDRMADRYSENHFDIFTFNYKEAISKGREIKIVKLLD